MSHSDPLGRRISCACQAAAWQPSLPAQPWEPVRWRLGGTPASALHRRPPASNPIWRSPAGHAGEVRSFPENPRASGCTRGRFSKAIRPAFSQCQVPISGHLAGATGAESAHPIRQRAARAIHHHWHGLHVPDDMDGHPRHAVGPGVIHLRVQSPEPRRHLLVPPTPHKITGPQVYKGLAGLFLVADAEKPPPNCLGGV